MESPESNADTITLAQATKQDRPVICQLIQLMHYDLSSIYGEWIGRDGRYAYRSLDVYWTEQDHHPYVIRRNGQLVGFALVTPRSPISGRAPCWFMYEFFVLQAQRRRGYGLHAVREILSRHRGNWEIAAIDKNEDAVSFWTTALARLQLADLAKESRTHDKMEWVVHTFVS